MLSVPGSTKYRLTAAGSGFANLYLAGDWTLNGLNFGCIESATMGGLEVSQAICGYPKEIVGTTDVLMAALRCPPSKKNRTLLPGGDDVDCLAPMVPRSRPNAIVGSRPPTSCAGSDVPSSTPDTAA